MLSFENSCVLVDCHCQSPVWALCVPGTVESDIPVLPSLLGYLRGLITVPPADTFRRLHIQLVLPRSYTPSRFFSIRLVPAASAAEVSSRISCVVGVVWGRPGGLLGRDPHPTGFFPRLHPHPHCSHCSLPLSTSCPNFCKRNRGACEAFKRARSIHNRCISTCPRPWSLGRAS